MTATASKHPGSVLHTGDFEHDFRAWVVASVAGLALVVGASLAIFDFLDNEPVIATIILVSPATMLIALWQLFVRHRLQLAANVAVLGMTIAVATVMAISGGQTTGPYVFLPAVFVAAITLCTWRFAIGIVIAGFLIFVIGGWLTTTDWVFPYETSQDRKFWGAYRLAIVSGVICFGCMAFYGKSMARMRQQLLVAQSRNLQSQKLEAIGTLASGIAHEINTPVQFVSDNLVFIGESCDSLRDVHASIRDRLDGANDADMEKLRSEISAIENEADVEYVFEELPQALAESREGLNRVRTIVLAMKEFAHPGEDKRTMVDLNAAVKSTLTVCENRWKYVADVATDLEPDLPSIDGLPDELNQVILNTVVNAADALQERIDAGDFERGQISVKTRVDGDFVELSISDNGAGIPPEIQERVFEPFFTTKSVGKGTGQGLAISYDVVVNRHAGELLCESEPGEGTTFRIRLPISS